MEKTKLPVGSTENIKRKRKPQKATLADFKHV
jgi:hypothetical protein